MKYKSLIILLMVGAGLLTMTSCLKDLEDHYGAFSSTTPVAELSENPNASTGTLIKSLPITGSAVELKIRVNIAANKPLEKDVTVTIDTSKANLDAFNLAKGTSYVMIADSMFSMPSKTITIPKGSNEADHIIMINTQKFDPSKVYILPLEITDAEGITISGNYGKTFVQLGAKNKYDGIYTVTAESPMLDVTSATLTGNYPFTYELRTSGAHRVECYDPNNGIGYRHRIFSGTSLSVYGNFGIVVNFNPDGSGQITSVTLHPNWAGNTSTRDAVMDATGVNTWNPTTKTVLISYIMLQPSVVTTPPHYRTFFNEKWTYVGPRP